MLSDYFSLGIVMAELLTSENYQRKFKADRIERAKTETHMKELAPEEIFKMMPDVFLDEQPKPPMDPREQSVEDLLFHRHFRSKCIDLIVFLTQEKLHDRLGADELLHESLHPDPLPTDRFAALRSALVDLKQCIVDFEAQLTNYEEIYTRIKELSAYGLSTDEVVQDVARMSTPSMAGRRHASQMTLPLRSHSSPTSSPMSSARSEYSQFAGEPVIPEDEEKKDSPDIGLKHS
jgi:hypothetical protein